MPYAKTTFKVLHADNVNNMQMTSYYLFMIKTIITNNSGLNINQTALKYLCPHL